MTFVFFTANSFQIPFSVTHKYVTFEKIVNHYHRTNIVQRNENLCQHKNDLTLYSTKYVASTPDN